MAPIGSRSVPARVLGDGDVGEARRLCAATPIDSILVDARLEVAQRSGLRAAGGRLWGFPAQGALEAVCWSGANLVPVLLPTMKPSRRRQAIAAFADQALREGRRSSSIVGEQQAVLALWDFLKDTWPTARDVRANQPSMVIADPPAVAVDPQVHKTMLTETMTILPASIAMFTEEVGYSPVQGGHVYEERVRMLIASGRSFARMTGFPPRVVFKAEIGAVTRHVAQVQGVWVDPEFRGRGLSLGGMAAVVAFAQAEFAPVVSLYVNDYNAPARAAYRRVGFKEVGSYATVLF